MSTATVDLPDLQGLKQPELKSLLKERGIEFPRGVVSNDRLRQLLADTATAWPAKGFTGAQPWENREVDVIEVDHGRPILSGGSAGAPVFELASLLHELGYETDVTRGLNALGVLGASEMGAVERFRADYGVREDPSGFGGETEDARRIAANHVGPWTWEALLRLTGRISS
jgi:peptidoglycan hydrolase-like protein with peptidoglycan-binding domain